MQANELSQMWDDAEQREAKRRAERPMSFYGQLEINGRRVVLEKGAPMGKRDFDPALDDPDAERLAIRITVHPVSERATRDFEREFLSNSPEADLFKQSAQALGTRVPELMGRYVRVDVVEDPRLGTFTDRTTGAARTRSAPVLRELFPDEATCKEASEARYGGVGTRTPVAHAGDWGVTVGGSGGAQGPQGGPGKSGGAMNRQTAAHFLPGLYATCGKDPEKFLQALTENKLLAEHFTAESPEVLAVLGITEGSGGTSGAGAAGDDVPF